MMNRLENAARQALEALENHPGNYKLSKAECVKYNAVEAALREALAEQQAAEPVAWANPNDLQNFDMKVRANGGPLHTVPLYTHPAPTQQPLTEYQKWRMYEAGPDMPSTAAGVYMRAVDDTEAAHGITSKKGGAA